MSNIIPHIAADEVKKMIDAKEDLALLDVRTPAEFGRGKIEGSINMPVDTLVEQIEKAVPGKSKKIIAYCLSGARSDVAVGEMMKLGYTNVFSMEKGLLLWRIKKYPVVL